MARLYEVSCGVCGTFIYIYVDGDRVTVKTTELDGTVNLTEAKNMGLVFASSGGDNQKSL